MLIWSAWTDKAIRPCGHQDVLSAKEYYTVPKPPTTPLEILATTRLRPPHPTPKSVAQSVKVQKAQGMALKHPITWQKRG